MPCRLPLIQAARHNASRTMRATTPQLKLLWLQSGGGGGCSLSSLCAELPDILTAFKTAGINLLWHPSLSEQGDVDLLHSLQSIVDGVTPLDLFCVEGAVVQGPNGTGSFNRLSGFS